MPILGSSASGAKSAPTAPTIGTATNVGTGRAYNNGAATVTFSAPSTSKLPIISYTVTSSPGGFTGTGASSPITVAGLQSSTSYTFTVTATSAAGTSSASSASNSITATTVPQAPTIGSATAGDGSATVTYTAGATGGSAVTTYTATSSPGGFTGTGSSPITVSGLSNGTGYTFTVTATNANGTSAASSASNSVTPVHNTIWVAVGTNSSIWTSTNGTTWSERLYSSGTSTLRNVAYANGYFASGDSGLCYRSSDGLTWTSVSNPWGANVGAQYGNLTGGNGYLAIMPNSSVGTLFYSSNGGSSWSSTSTGLQTPSSGTYGVHYSTLRGAWFATTNAASGTLAQKTTTTPPTSGWTSVTAARGINQPMEIMETPTRGPYAFQNTGGPSQYYNGTSFVSIGTANLTGTGGWVTDVSAGAVIVIGAGGGTVNYSSSYTPSSYTTLTVTSGGSSNLWSISGQESGSPRWMAVGENSNIWTSDSADTWTQRSAPRASQIMWKVRKI